MYQHNFGQECYCADFSTNDQQPYFAAAFADNKIRVWSYKDFISGDKTVTLDKPKFEIQGDNYGSVDIKINSLGNRLAVSSIDSELSIYNIDPEKGPEKALTHHKNLSDSYLGQLDIAKFDFHPTGNEILGGTSTLKVFDISSGNMTREFAQGHKLTSSVVYSKNGHLCANG